LGPLGSKGLSWSSDGAIYFVLPVYYAIKVKVFEPCSGIPKRYDLNFSDWITGLVHSS